MAWIGVALKTIFVATDESAVTSQGNDDGGLAKCCRLSALAVDVAGTQTTNAVNVLFGILLAKAMTREEARKPRTFFTKHKMETIHFRPELVRFTPATADFCVVLWNRISRDLGESGKGEKRIDRGGTSMWVNNTLFNVIRLYKYCSNASCT